MSLLVGQSRDHKRPGLILRVLSGPQQGAAAQMRHSRLLVGNIETECDVVLDLGSAQRSACLIRSSQSGWSVLCIAGSLHIDGLRVPPQEARTMSPSDVLTLEGVSFCITDPDDIDWAGIEVPEPRPSVDPKTVPVVAAAVSARAGRVSVGLVSFLFAVLLLLVAGALYLVPMSVPAQAAQRTAGAAVDSTRQLLSIKPWAGEVAVVVDPIKPSRVILSGYLPDNERQRELQRSLRDQGIGADFQTAVVTDLVSGLSSRVSVADANAASTTSYIGQGRLAITSSIAKHQALDRSVRLALLDLPSIQAIEVHYGDNAPAPPLVYARSEAAPGGVTLSGLEKLQSAQRLAGLEVVEVRLGRYPSVVLADGARYFEGAALSDGMQLLQIRPGQLLVSVGGETRRVRLKQEALIGAVNDPGESMTTMLNASPNSPRGAPPEFPNRAVPGG